MARGYPDFEGDKSGVYLKTGWAAVEGDDKLFYAAFSAKGFGLGDYIDYTVGAGKILYLCGAAFSLRANAAADADNNQIGLCSITGSGLIVYARLGGNGGGQVNFDPPIPIAAGGLLRTRLANYANHDCDGSVASWGYEV